MNALEGFTRQAALELSSYGISVHAVEDSSEKIVENVFNLLEVERESR
jgi:hypothetical protein